jgi:NAD+ synthase (glutamine-hydrolysing)
MKIAIAQINVSLGDFEHNKFKIIDAITQAKQNKADLVVFAESVICGTPARSLLARYGFLDKVEEALVEIAAFCDDIAVLVGLPIQQQGATMAAAAYIKNRRVMRYITKGNLASDVDAAYLAEGRGVEYINVAGEKVAVVVGADVFDDAAYHKADTVVVLGADRYSQGRIERRYSLIAEKAYMADANMIFVNQVGGTGEVIFDGSSCAFNSKGKPIALLGSFVEEIAFVDTAADNAELEVPYQDKIANVYGALTLAIRDYFNKNRYEKACLVMTGGVDSSLAAVLLTDALGADRVVGLQMPSRHLAHHAADDAEALATALGIELVTIPLHDIYRSSLDTIVAAIGEPESERLEGDFQMRLRTALFMAVCDKRGYVPVNCSNKTELAIGALTLYGDTSGMISILGDLYKSDIFAVARHINNSRNIIPEATLLRTPSSEKIQGEKYGNLPTYDVIDAILYRMLERWQDREEIIDAGFEESDVDAVRAMIYASLEMFNQFCPIVAVSPMPLDRSYVDLPKSTKSVF